MAQVKRTWLLGAGLAVATSIAALYAWLGPIAPVRVASPPDELGTASADRRAAAFNAVCSARNPAGVGLRGEYFADEGMRGAPLLVRVDGTVDFEASLAWPQELADRRPRSVRWSGWIRAPISGRYRFHGSLPELRVLVGRELVAGDGAAPDAGVMMTAGRYHPITIELERLTASDGFAIRVEWTAPHGSRYVPPRALLYQPTESVTAPGRS